MCAGDRVGHQAVVLRHLEHPVLASASIGAMIAAEADIETIGTLASAATDDHRRARPAWWRCR
jgi:hypothetical protein